MGKDIIIKTKAKTFNIPEGKPVIITWKSKNKSRQGYSTAVGWIKRGKDPHTVTLIHSCFQTWDKVEQEYPAAWTVWMSQIMEIRTLSTQPR